MARKRYSRSNKRRNYYKKQIRKTIRFAIANRIGRRM